MRKIRLKQSKGQAIIGLLIGFVFIIFGFMFVIPTIGLIGWAWMAFALMITIINSYHLFGNQRQKNNRTNGDEGPIIMKKDFEG